MSGVLELYTGKLLHEASINSSIANFKAGDTVTVKIRNLDETSERISLFTGVCIERRRNGLASACVVRKMSGSVAVERTIPIYSPLIVSIEIVKPGAVRRAKIFYLRKLIGKRARIKEDKSLRAKRRMCV